MSYTQLVKKIEDGKVKSITYQPDGSIIEVKGSYKKAEKVDTDLSLPVSYTHLDVYKRQTWIRFQNCHA